MHSNFSGHISIIRFAAFALLALFLVQLQFRAQEEVSLGFHTISWGMVSGQTVRFTMGNPSGPVNTELTRQVTIVVDLLDARGAVIATSDEIVIPPDAFRSIYFKRDDLPVTGERVQMRAQVRYRTFAIVDRSNLTVFSPSIELIDDVTGHTTLLVSQKSKEIDNSTDRTTAVRLTVGFFEVVQPREPQ